MRRLLILTSLILASACAPDLAKVHPSDWPPLPQNPTVSVQTIPPSPSHRPETLITTINVVDKLHKPLWNLDEVLVDWNKVKYVKFRLVKECPTYQPCVTVLVKNLPPYQPGEVTVGQTTWGGTPDEMEIDLSPFQLSNRYAQSTICHEFGHLIGLGHVIPKKHHRVKTCMLADDDFAPISPTDFDIKIANRLGPWTWDRSQDSSGKDIDAEDSH